MQVENFPKSRGVYTSIGGVSTWVDTPGGHTSGLSIYLVYQVNQVFLPDQASSLMARTNYTKHKISQYHGSPLISYFPCSWTYIASDSQYDEFWPLKWMIQKVSKN